MPMAFERTGLLGKTPNICCLDIHALAYVMRSVTDIDFCEKENTDDVDRSSYQREEKGNQKEIVCLIPSIPPIIIIISNMIARARRE